MFFGLWWCVINSFLKAQISRAQSLATFSNFWMCSWKFMTLEIWNKWNCEFLHKRVCVKHYVIHISIRRKLLRFHSRKLIHRKMLLEKVYSKYFEICWTSGCSCSLKFVLLKHRWIHNPIKHPKWSFLQN